MIMKKFIWILAAGLLLTVLTGKASADSIYEPRNEFYNDHYNEVKRTIMVPILTANGPNGTVKGYKSPENAQVVEEFKNGAYIDIIGTYTDVAGIDWGLHAGPGISKESWIPMLYLMEPFGEDIFMEQYKEEIRIPADGEPESGTFEKKDLKLYFYPAGDAYPREMISDAELSASWKDASGHSWYRYTAQGTAFWVCADKPEASLEELYPDGIPNLDKRFTAAGGNEPEIEPKNRTIFKNAFFILLGLSGAAMIAMAIIVNVGVAKNFRNKR